MIAPAAAAEPTLRLDEVEHRAFLGTRELVRATTALQDVGIIDARWFTDDSRLRGQYLHEAVRLWYADELHEPSLDVRLQPYWAGVRAFAADLRFEPRLVEQAVYDESAGYAGRLDLLGVLPTLPPGFDDLIDIKTGQAPPWVALQTMGYRRRLSGLRCRRWALELPGDGTYRLLPLNLTADRQRIDGALDRQHEAVFLAAVTVARWKRGL